MFACDALADNAYWAAVLADCSARVSADPSDIAAVLRHLRWHLTLQQAMNIARELPLRVSFCFDLLLLVKAVCCLCFVGINTLFHHVSFIASFFCCYFIIFLIGELSVGISDIFLWISWFELMLLWWSDQVQSVSFVFRLLRDLFCFC